MKDKLDIKNRLNVLFPSVKGEYIDKAVAVLEYLAGKDVSWVRGIIFQGDVVVTRPTIFNVLDTEISIVDHILSPNDYTYAAYFKDGIVTRINSSDVNTLSVNELFISLGVFSAVKITSKSLAEHTVIKRRGLEPVTKDFVRTKKTEKTGKTEKTEKIPVNRKPLSDGEEKVAINMTGDINFELGKKRSVFSKKKGKIKVKKIKFNKGPGKLHRTKGF